MRISRLPALLALAAALALSGCKSPCRQLSEKLCDCQDTTLLREACLTKVSAEQARLGTSAADEQLCTTLLPGCDCHQIKTEAGKKACGLARQ